MLKQKRLWISVLVSVVFLWLALRGQNFSATWGAIRHADYWFLAPALALYFIGVWVRSVRWKVLLEPIHSFSASALFPVVVIGYMANDVLPARMGELVRVYVLSQRRGVPKTAALGTIVVERLLDACAMLGILLLAGTMVSLNSQVRGIALLAGAVVLLGLAAVLALAAFPSRIARAFGLLRLVLPDRFVDRGSGAAGSFLSGLSVARSPRVFLYGLSLSLLAWLFEAGMYGTVARGFGLHVTVGIILLTLAVANLATLVPAAPGFVGTFEAGCLLVLVGLAGLDREVATGYVLALHAALVIPVTLLGLYYWSRHHLSLYRIRREVAGTTSAHQVVDGGVVGREMGRPYDPASASLD